MFNERSATKRPRWTVNGEACTFCRKRKSRCRITSTTGACERCRESDLRCSLQTEDNREDDTQHGLRETSNSMAEGSSRGHEMSNYINESRRLLIRLDAKTDHLMDILRGQDGSQDTGTRRLSSSHEILGREFSGTREDGVGDDDDIEDEVQDLLSRRLGTSLLYVTGMNLHDRTSFIDPVGAGLISDTGMGSVMERFHGIMDKICPMRELLDSLVDERHPFLRSCVLPYLTFTRSSDKEDLAGHLRGQSVLRDNLNRLPSSNPALPIITGLVILSLTPTSGFEERYTRQVDGWGYISKAVDMALADGLDDNAVIGLRQPYSELVNNPGLRLVKHKTMLWYVVAHRAAWVEILTSPSFSSRPSLSPAFSAVFPSKPLGSALLTHLYHESRLLAVLATFSASFRRTRQTTAYDSLQLQALRSDLAEYRNSIQQWERDVEADSFQSGAFLVFNSILVNILVYFKVTTDCVTRAPSPLCPDDRFTFFRDCLKDMRARSVDCIRYATANQMDLGILPAFHLTLAFLPFKVLRSASQIDPNGSLELFNTTAVTQYRAMLCSSHRLGASMVAHIENHIPSPSWGQLVESFETGIPVVDHQAETEDYADLFRSMFESDALFDFQYPPNI